MEDERYTNIQEAAAHIVRYFSERKFTVDDARRAIDMAGRWITAASTVNVDEKVIAGFGIR